MFNEISSTDGNELLSARLTALEQELRTLSLPTREEMQAEVYSRLNEVLNMGNKMAPVVSLIPQGPAVVGDITQNFEQLNQDGLGISQQLLGLENEAARLFNLFASTQNSLRQQVREQVYQPTLKRYLEPFVNNKGLDSSSTASFDFSAGMASLPFSSETQVAIDSVTLGVLCAGSLDGTLTPLTDGKSETSIVWNGSQIDLVLSFSQPKILNRLHIELDDYQGLNLERLVSSSDGVQQEDLLAEQTTSTRSLDGSSNKFSGDVTVDFDARHVSKLRIVISDRAGAQLIRLRGISCFARRYQSAGQVQSLSFTFPELGIVRFSTEQHVTYPLTSISHQVSFDGTQYRYIQPGDSIDIGGKTCWYRAFLERIDDSFTPSDKAPLEELGLAPDLDGTFRLLSVNSIQLGGNVIERSMVIDLLAGTSPTNSPRLVNLRETPLPDSLTIYQGAALLGPEQYTLTADTLYFLGSESRSSLQIRYQIPANASKNLLARKEFYTPRLYQVAFERA